MTHITYKLVPKKSQEFEALQEFAQSFDHEITEHPNVNVYAHYKNGQLFGYSDHVFLPTVYPAFHPKFTTPRDVVQVLHDWRAYLQISGGAGYIGVPLAEDRPNFSEEVMKKLGLERNFREIYSL